MARRDLKDKLNLKEGVEVKLDETSISIKGSKGELKRRIFFPGLKIKKEDKFLSLEIKNASKKEKMIMKTTKAHINNMLKGVTEGFSYSLKICSGHFPITVNQEGDKLIIKNFLGEKIPRIAKIYEGVNVEINKDMILLSGHNIESVGQTAANMEKSTKITNRDRRRFQDGIYIVEKAGVKL